MKLRGFFFLLAVFLSETSFTAMRCQGHLEDLDPRYTLHLNTIAANLGGPFPTSVLLELIPRRSGENSERPNGNLSVAVDVSGSMQSPDGTGISRVYRALTALTSGTTYLASEDMVSMVWFNDTAATFLEPTPAGNRRALEQATQGINAGGDTNMLAGLNLAYEHLKKGMKPGRLNHIIVLTDGNTDNREKSIAFIAALRKEQIEVTLLGFGTDFNEVMFAAAAQLGARWHYIDAQTPDQASHIFKTVFNLMADASFTNAHMTLRPMFGTELQQLLEVTPQVRDLTLERHTAAGLSMVTPNIGMISRFGSRTIANIALPPRPAGKFVNMMIIEVTYDTPDGHTRQLTFPIDVEYGREGNTNARVQRFLDDVQMFNYSQQLSQATPAQATIILGKMQKQATQMGSRGASYTQMINRAVQTTLPNGNLDPRTRLGLTQMSANPDQGPANASSPPTSSGSSGPSARIESSEIPNPEDL